MLLNFLVFMEAWTLDTVNLRHCEPFAVGGISWWGRGVPKSSLENQWID